jgi:hypothetical protein
VSCSLTIYESPVTRARGVWEQHWHNCPYTGFYGYIYWEYMWYRLHPYESWVLYSHAYPPKSAVRKITKEQLLKKVDSESEEKSISTTKVTKRTVKGTQVKAKGKKTKKVTKKKDV